MLENISPEIIEALERAISIVLPILGVKLGFYFLRHCLSDCGSSLPKCPEIKRHFNNKPKEKKSVEFCYEYDNGFFNSDVYNSGGENNE